MYNFEKLEAWQQAMVLTEVIYRLVKQLLVTEKFALVAMLCQIDTSQKNFTLPPKNRAGVAQW